MSIKYGLLALLDRDPKYGYQLRTQFEQATGATWPLNLGQVYTTLSRLERDELARSVGQDADGRAVYEITRAGQEALREWFATPVAREARPRDELAIKLALALTVPGVDVRAIVQAQRRSTVQTLQQLTRLKRDEESELSWLLVLESMIFQAEAEIRWLEHCEARLVQSQRSQPQPGHPEQAPPKQDQPDEPLPSQALLGQTDTDETGIP